MVFLHYKAAHPELVRGVPKIVRILAIEHLFRLLCRVSVSACARGSDRGLAGADILTRQGRALIEAGQSHRPPLLLSVTARWIRIVPPPPTAGYAFHTRLRKGLKSSIPHWTPKEEGREKHSKEISFVRRERVRCFFDHFLVSSHFLETKSRKFRKLQLCLHSALPVSGIPTISCAIIPSSVTAITFFLSAQNHFARRGSLKWISM